jgi:hypothetical protein
MTITVWQIELGQELVEVFEEKINDRVKGVGEDSNEK